MLAWVKRTAMIRVEEERREESVEGWMSPPRHVVGKSHIQMVSAQHALGRSRFLFLREGVERANILISIYSLRMAQAL